MANVYDEWLQALGVAAEKFLPTAPQEANGSEPKPEGMKFGFNVPLPKKKVKAWGGRIEIELSVQVHISGCGGLTAANSSKLTAIGTKAVFAWQEKTANPIFGNGSIFSNLKLARQGASLVATSSTNTTIGKFDLTITFLKLEKKLHSDTSLDIELKVGEVEGAWEPAKLKLPDQVIDGVKVTDLELSVAGSISIAAQWKEILEKWAVEAAKGYLKDAAETAAKGVSVEISGEVVITGSIAALGVATIGGGIYELVRALAIQDLVKSYDPCFAAVKAGFKAGMSNGPEPGDRFGKAGYVQGKANFDQLFARAKRDNPKAPDEAIKKAIVARADEALKEVSGAMGRAVEVALWDGYLAKHKGDIVPLISSDASTAYLACFGKEPDESSSEWKKYREQHPVASKF
jgi:hypothetical protein